MAASLMLREVGLLVPNAVKCVADKSLLRGPRPAHSSLHCRQHAAVAVRSASTAAGKSRGEQGAGEGGTKAAPAVRRAHSLHCRQHAAVAVRASSTEAGKTQAEQGADKGGSEPAPALPDPVDQYKERYIPISRRSIVRFMAEEDNFLTEEEKKELNDFALALDSAIVNKYHGILQRLKSLFDPINPDKLTVASREYSRRDRLDNEYWLLQLMEDIMKKANFHELDKQKLHRVLAEHESSVGVKVCVNPDRYDVLRFWVLGRERIFRQPTLYQRLVNRILKRRSIPKPAVDYYKRVVVAIRLKKDSTLHLKAFKEIPSDRLQVLLPDGILKMNMLDKGVLWTSLGIAMSGIVAKSVTILTHINLDWMLLLTFFTGFTAFRAWSHYKNRRNEYMVEVSRTLYFKNLANNQGLLAHLVDRAEDESFKEALLTYAFLLANQPEKTRLSEKNRFAVPQEIVGLSDVALETRVEEWIKKKTGLMLEFDSSEAKELLKRFGVLREFNDKLTVLSLPSALQCLPITPQSLIMRSTEADIKEGYDRDEYLETEAEYKFQDRMAKKYGWF